MREIVVISGKGGSGKTSVTAALADLISKEEPLVLCDFDVDAPDLHIIAKPTNTVSTDFVSGHTAIFKPDDCIDCGQCLEFCAFDAINQTKDGQYPVQESACEGCKVCVELCPTQAFDFVPRHCGHSFVSQTRFGTFVHAQLTPGAENSGRLITLLKQQAKSIARANNIETILCDGTPGIGCPVISSLSGATMALIVVEATPSGLSDFERVHSLCKHFRLPVAVIINKADLNPTLTDTIREKVPAMGATIVGELPFDRHVTAAMIETQTLIEHGGELAQTLRTIWDALKAFLKTHESKRRRSIPIQPI